MRRPPRNTKLAVAHTLYKIIVSKKSTWCYVKLSTIQKYLKKYYNIPVGLSDISYHLWTLHRDGYIKVFTRWKRLDNGWIVNLPSNRQITGKLISWFKRYGIKVENYLYNWSFKGIKPARAVAKYKPHPTPSTFTRPARRPAGPPESVGNILKTIKLEPS